MAYTRRRSDWKDFPDTSTPIRASDLNGIEAGLESAAAVADTALTTATTASNRAEQAINSVAGAAADAASAAASASTAISAAASAAPASRGVTRSPLLSRKFRGGNIAPKPGGYGWQGLFAEWDWTNWIKPQVDRAAALGLNAIRLIGGPRCVFVDPIPGTLPKITQTQYDARWAQLAQYCLDKGLWLYPCLVAKWDHVDVYGVGANFQDPAIQTSVQATATTLSRFSNVIGFDLFQEGDAGTAVAWKASTAYALNALVNNNGNSYKVTTAGTSAASGGPTTTSSSITDGSVVWAYQGKALLPADVLAMMAAVRSVANLPLTMSRSLSDGFGWTDTTSMWYSVFNAANGADFLDFHVYLDGVQPGDPDFQILKHGKPVLFGEYGAPQNISGANQTARYNAMSAIHNRRGVLGSFAWALADQKTSANPEDQWGIWDNTGFAGTFPFGSTAPLSVTSGKRTGMTDVLPKLILADRIEVAYEPPNLLSAAQQNPRNVITSQASGWVSGTNTYLYSEQRGLGFSAVAAGTSFVATTPSTGIPVAAATYHRAYVEVLAGATPRNVSMNVDWFDAAGAYLTSSPSATGTDSTVVPLKLELYVRSHTNASYGVVVVKVTDAAQIANEAHIVLAGKASLRQA